MTCEMRFMSNNGVEAATITASANQVGYEPDNVTNQRRASYWLQTGYFKVEATANKIYINDGTDLVATIPPQEVFNGDDMAAIVEDALNFVSSSWTCSFDSVTGYFTIDRLAGTKILRLSEQTDAVWDTIGYLGVIDIIAGIADAPRYHSFEWLLFDMGAAFPGDFFAMIGPSGEDFPVSSNATVRIQGNSINFWDAPPFDEVATVSSDGVFHFSTAVEPQYRYYRVVIEDRENSLNENGLPISHIYIGDYVTLTQTNLSKGFTFRNVDSSKVKTTIGGQKYFDQRKKYALFTAMTVRNLTETERIALETEFLRNGIQKGFYLSLDPSGIFSTDLADFTKLVRYNRDPVLQHVFLDKFNINFEAQEVL